MDLFERTTANIKYGFYRLRYGPTAPRPFKAINVDPTKIKYGFPSKIRQGTKWSAGLPSYGIIGGDWDQYRIEMDKTAISIGLKERYIQNMDWKNTTYYKYSIERLRSEGSLPTLDDYEQSETGLMKYFSYLDKLYEDIKTNGFKDLGQIDKNDLPSIHIGRGGELIGNHGAHRRIMCTILDLSSIPVIVNVRHTKWQNARVDVYEKHRERDKIHGDSSIKHPDLADLTGDGVS